jgi:hypothetical protein
MARGWQSFRVGAGSVEIWTAPIEGDASHPQLRKAVPFLQTQYNTIQPAFSPDGLAFNTSEPGKAGLWVVPFPDTGGGWLISSRGDAPIRSPNGREMFFLKDFRTIMVAGYHASGDALGFDKPQLWSPHSSLDLGFPPIGTIDLAPDGKRFAVVLNADGTADHSANHLTFRLNFFDELKRRGERPAPSFPPLAAASFLRGLRAEKTSLSSGPIFDALRQRFNGHSNPAFLVIWHTVPLYNRAVPFTESLRLL